MAIGVYKDGVRVSEDYSMTNPVLFRIVPTGGEDTVQLTLRHEVLSGYGAEGSLAVTVSAATDLIDDYSSWLTFSDDDITYVSVLDVGDLPAGSEYTFYAKMDIPSFTNGSKDDIYIKVYSESTQNELPIPFINGAYNGTYAHPDGSLRFNVGNVSGWWMSDWVNASNIDIYKSANYSVAGSGIYFSYRTSSDATDGTATAWVNDIRTLGANNYLQIKIDFQAPPDSDTPGLYKNIYRNTNFSVFQRGYAGGLPFSDTPAEEVTTPNSVRYTGFLRITESGQHQFKLRSADGHRMWINDELRINNWTSVSSSEILESSVFQNLTVGVHKFKLEWYNDPDGVAKLEMYITTPGDPERAVQLTDFWSQDQELIVEYLNINFSGDGERHHDTKIFYGPAVPILLSPEDGAISSEYKPDLTIDPVFGENLQIQVDQTTAFLGVNSQTWTEPINGTYDIITTSPPVGVATHGQWYWRARTEYDSIYSQWSNPRSFTIEELIPTNEFVFLNVNVAAADNLNDPYDGVICIYANNSPPSQFAIQKPRFLYLNAYNMFGDALVLYPFRDNTRARKLFWEGDSEDTFDEGP